MFPSQQSPERAGLSEMMLITMTEICPCAPQTQPGNSSTRPGKVSDHTSPAWRMEMVFGSGRYECAVTSGDFHEDLDGAGGVILPLQHNRSSRDNSAPAPTSIPIPKEEQAGEMSNPYPAPCSPTPFPFICSLSIPQGVGDTHSCPEALQIRGLQHESIKHLLGLPAHVEQHCKRTGHGQGHCQCSQSPVAPWAEEPGLPLWGSSSLLCFGGTASKSSAKEAPLRFRGSLGRGDRHAQEGTAARASKHCSC